MKVLGAILLLVGFIVGALAALLIAFDRPIWQPGTAMMAASVLVFTGAGLLTATNDRLRLRAMHEIESAARPRPDKSRRPEVSSMGRKGGGDAS